MVPLKYELKNGDIVEVVTRGDAKPSRDWLNIVKTTKAKNRIRHYFRQLDKEENIKQGKNLLTAELERCNTSLAEVLKKDRLLEIAQKMNFKTLDELLTQIGDGNISSRTVAVKLGLELPPTQPLAHAASASATVAPGKQRESVMVHGLAGMVTRFAQCCHPIPGDAVIGYITQGRGVSIHRADCPNVQVLPDEAGRRVVVAWDDVQQEVAHVLQLFVQAHDRDRLQTDLLQAFEDVGAQVKESSTRSNKQQNFEGMFKIQVKGKDHLREVVRSVEKVKGVFKVARK
jgi:GTP pyrophosphokinase